MRVLIAASLLLSLVDKATAVLVAIELEGQLASITSRDSNGVRNDGFTAAVLPFGLGDPFTARAVYDSSLPVDGKTVTRFDAESIGFSIGKSHFSAIVPQGSFQNDGGEVFGNDSFGFDGQVDEDAFAQAGIDLLLSFSGGRKNLPSFAFSLQPPGGAPSQLNPFPLELQSLPIDLPDGGSLIPFTASLAFPNLTHIITTDSGQVVNQSGRLSFSVDRFSVTAIPEPSLALPFAALMCSLFSKPRRKSISGLLGSYQPVGCAAAPVSWTAESDGCCRAGL